MVEGTFRFYQNGELVGESKNLVTTLGKRAILRYLAGQIESYAGGIVVGTNATAASVSDVSLNFEVARVPVDVKAVKDYSTFDIVYRASLPPALACKINEIGLITDPTNSARRGVTNSVLSNMDTSELWTSIQGVAITQDSTNHKLGSDAIKLNTVVAGTPTIVTLPVQYDFTKYLATDKFSMQFGTFDTGLVSIKIEFIDVAGLSFYKTLTYGVEIPAHTAGGGVFQSQTVATLLSAFNNWAYTWSDIRTVKITVTSTGGGTTVMLDGLAVIDTNTVDEASVLVSRSIPSTIVKAVNAEMDVEYTLRFAL